MSEKLKELSGLEYKTVLRNKNGQYSLIIPDLALIGVGKNVQEALDNLTALKNKYFENMIDLGLADEIPLPNLEGIRIVKDIVGSLRYKIAQYGFIFFLVLVGFFVIKTSVQGSLKSVGKEFNQRVLTELEKDQDPEVQTRRLEKFRKVLQAYSPFIEEVKKVWK